MYSFQIGKFTRFYEIGLLPNVFKEMFLMANQVHSYITRNSNTFYIISCPNTYTGLLIFRGKKPKILRDFQGQIRGKIDRFRGIFAGKKSKFAEQSADFTGEKSKFAEKSADFAGF